MSKKLIFVVYFFLTLFVAGCSLIAPNPDVAAPNFSVSMLGSEIRIPANTDSAEFARLVVKFPKGFVEDKTRIARPLYTVLALPAFMLVRNFIPTHAGIEKKFEERVLGANRSLVWDDVGYKDFIAAWISLIFVNLMVIVLGVWLMYLFFREYFNELISFALPLFVLASDMCKTYILVPHSEAFVFLIPAFTAWLCMKIDKNWHGDSRSNLLYASSLCLGILFLGKGMIFVAAVVVLFMLYKKLPLRRVLCSAVFVALSTAVLFSALKSFDIFYMHEIAANQGVWFIPYLSNYDFIGLFSVTFDKILQEMIGIALVFRYEIFLIISILIFAEAKISNRVFLKIYFVVCLLFWIWVGFIPNRMMHSLFPCLLYVLGQCFSNLSDRKLKLAVFAALIFVFASNYLFSSFSVLPAYLL